MRAAIAGDAGAYRRFLVSVTPHLRQIARYRCRVLGASDSDAEDVLQEVLLAIHLKQGTWDRTRPIGPWIGAIVRNKLVDALRRRGRRVIVPIEDVMETLAQEERTEDDVSDHVIDTLLGKLSKLQREIVRSISLGGSSVRETAERLSMTEGAVRVALHRALKTLAALYRSEAS